MNHTPGFRLFVAALLLGFLIIAPVLAVSATLGADEQKTCEEEGGCALVTRKWVREQLAKAYETGKQYSDVTCGKRTGYPFDNFKDGEFHGTRR